MKALVLERYNELVYKNIPDPVCGPGEVIISVRACGICGSDVHGMDGSTGRRIPPIVMGHEASGEIVDVGTGVEGFAAGDRVTFDSTVYCGACPYCRSGRVNLCDNRRVLGVSCDEYRMNGAFAEYVAVPARILYALPDGLSYEQAAMVEPLTVAMHAVRLARPALNSRAVVIGAGIIGLSVVQFLRASGCGAVIAADTDSGRLELAHRLGAHMTIDAGSADIASETHRLTGGADTVFDAVGIGETLASAVDSLVKGGTLVLVGNLVPSVPLPLQKVVARQLSVLGSCASSGEYPDCLDMTARGTVDTAPLISGVAPLAEGAQWFKRLYNREAGLMKVMLAP